MDLTYKLPEITQGGINRFLHDLLIGSRSPREIVDHYDYMRRQNSGAYLLTEAVISGGYLEIANRNPRLPRKFMGVFYGLLKAEFGQFERSAGKETLPEILTGDSVEANFIAFQSEQRALYDNFLRYTQRVRPLDPNEVRTLVSATHLHIQNASV